MTLPTPGMRPTGRGRRKVSTSLGWMTKRPSGLRQSEAILARNLLGATPAEAVRFSSSRICWRMALATRVAVGRSGLVFGDVEIGFVEGERLDEVGVALEDFACWRGDGAVASEVRRDEDCRAGRDARHGRRAWRSGRRRLGLHRTRRRRRSGCRARQRRRVCRGGWDRRVARRRRRRRPCRYERSCGRSSGNMVCVFADVHV